MVFKHEETANSGQWMFENDVKMYGIQTKKDCCRFMNWFENDVKMYGIQTSSS